MAQRDNILQELKELQSSLVDVASQNIYRVPAGYFEGLAEKVMRRIKALEAENAGEELAHLSSLLVTSKEMSYAVPAGYFEMLPGQVLSRIRAMETDSPFEELQHLSPLVAGISKAMPNDIPAGYFEGLAEAVAGSVKSEDQNAAEELETISPLLSGLKKEMPFSVPTGYFENLDKISGAEPVKPKAKVISLTKKTWFRYAAAAVVTGIVVVFGFVIFSKQGTIDPKNQSSEWVKKNLKKVSTDEIEKFAELADEGTLAIVTDAKNDIKEVSEIKDMIKDIPDEEIQKFLDETQTSVVDENSDDIFMN